MKVTKKKVEINLQYSGIKKEATDQGVIKKDTFLHVYGNKSRMKILKKLRSQIGTILIFIFFDIRT